MNQKDLKFLTECPYLAQAKICALEYSGVKFIGPKNVYIGEDVEIGARTLVWPGVVLLGNTKIGEGCEIGPDITLEDTVVGNNTKIKRGCEISRSQIGNHCVLNPFCYISDSSVGDNCTIWVNVSMFRADVEENVIVHRDTRIVWSKIGARTDLEASCQIKYANIGSDCRICHSIIEGDKFDDAALIAGKRTIFIGHACAIGPWAYIYEKVIINPEARIAQSDITNSFIGKRVRAYRCRIEESKILHDSIIEEGAYIHDHSTIHPYCQISRGEITRSSIGRNTKSKHCSYIGDVKMGCDCNVGAGTVFGNYDGERKNQCEVGDSVSIGINNSIVSKSVKKIGDRAYTGAHTLLTKEVEPDTVVVREVGPQKVLRGVMNKSGRKGRKS